MILKPWRQKNNISESQSTRDDKIDDLFVLKGGLEKQLELLTQQLKGIDLLDQLKKELADLLALISTLTLTIEQRNLAQKTNRDKAMLAIEKSVVFILKNDLDKQGEFKRATKVDIDFYGDSFSLDDNFNFSASSNTYFKNAIRCAIFILLVSHWILCVILNSYFVTIWRIRGWKKKEHKIYKIL